MSCIEGGLGLFQHFLLHHYCVLVSSFLYFGAVLAPADYQVGDSGAKYRVAAAM